MIGAIKRPVFRAIAGAERVVRVFGTGKPSLHPSDLARVRKFIIPLAHSYLGSAVHETPLVEAIRSVLPSAEIVVAGSGIAAEVYRNHPGVSRLEDAPNPNVDFWGALGVYRRIVRSFDREPWCALLTVWNSRSRVALAMMLSGGGVRAGHAVAPPLVHLPLNDDHQASQIAKNLRLPGLLGHLVPQDLEPRVYFSEVELKHAQDLLSDASNRPVAVLITCTSGGQPTRWPDERFVSVARRLIAVHGCRVVLPGTEKDIEETTRLAGEIGEGALSLAGKTSISELAAVCALSDIVAAVDTGAMHVARAQEVPLAIIAPGWQDSIEWMPVGRPWARILKGPRFPPPPPANYAIEEVSVEEVNRALDELLVLYPPSFFAREARVQRSVLRRGQSVGREVSL